MHKLHAKGKMILSVYDFHFIKRSIDTDFPIHADFNIHTGDIMTCVWGVPIFKSSRQEFITRSSTKSELVGYDNMYTMILREILLMEAQGYRI